MASFLIVEDNALVWRALSRLFGRYGPCHVAGSCADAKEQMPVHPDWDGFVIDIRLGDGSGLDILEMVRRLFADTPAMVISGGLDREVINRAAVLNARFVAKPCGPSELAPFLSDVLFRTTGDRLLATTELARHRWSLSEREAAIVESSLRGQTRDAYMLAQGINANTFKTQVRRLLEKTGYENLSRLALDLLNEG
jgi:DNA-binding NarL/FixJ family response regulator